MLLTFTFLQGYSKCGSGCPQFSSHVADALPGVVPALEWLGFCSTGSTRRSSWRLFSTLNAALHILIHANIEYKILLYELEATKRPSSTTSALKQQEISKQQNMYALLNKLYHTLQGGDVFFQF
jgi:hypothetical protein